MGEGEKIGKSEQTKKRDGGAGLGERRGGVRWRRFSGTDEHDAGQVRLILKKI